MQGSGTGETEHFESLLAQLQAEPVPPVEDWSELNIQAANPKPSLCPKPASGKYGKAIAKFKCCNEVINGVGVGAQGLKIYVMGHPLSNPAEQKALITALYVFNRAINAMSTGLTNAIYQMDAGNPPTVTFTPGSLPPWPSGKPADLLTSIWNVINPILLKINQGIDKKYGTDPLVIALGQLIQSGDQLIQVIEHFYPPNSAVRANASASEMQG
ncbi:hypothetical protein [Erythrobacter sp. F6033]|uniref:hypothetical protein n=1 Tax=Erythrobacter sp. F6033 TaxID=2926401 RepID=UPI001FF65638|nr:hypothetical protein [Erythrobacter sp. F6033]MCK0127585.1 hypothetical protein [Erythrobacter sp. F6033]